MITAVLFIFFSSAYFTWRITVLNQEALLFSVIFIIAEFFGLLMTYATIFVTWKVRTRRPGKPPPGHKIDVFIPTFNEPGELVRITALAARNMHYPHGTWILDDGNRPEIKQLAEELGCIYLARENNTHAKAGNLNNALNHSQADFIAIFDADHVPEENFLDRLLGYFNDPAVAYVQSPQDFYNIDSFQFINNHNRKLLWHDQTFFYQIGQAGRDYWNATSFCGTTAIIRRSALDQIGGFATATVTEDMHTAVKLQKLGYQSVYHPESLAYGVAATSYVEYLQQRLRWGHGNVQTLREEGLPLCKGLTLPQRLCYFALGLVYFEGWSRLILYFTPAIVLLTGIAPIGDTRLFFWFFVPYFLAAYFCIEEFGRGSTRFFASEYMAMARFPVFLLSTLGLVYKRRRFRITSKAKSEHVPAYLILPQLLILVFNTSAFAVGIVAPPEILVMSMSGGTIMVICFWAAFNMILSGGVIYSIIPRNRLSAEQKFKIPLPIKINSGGQGRGATVNELASDNISFTATLERLPDIHDVITCELAIQDHIFSLHVRIDDIEPAGTENKYNLAGRIMWQDNDSRDLLNLKLRHCTWYRRITYRDGFFPTPLERLAFVLNPVTYVNKLRILTGKS